MNNAKKGDILPNSIPLDGPSTLHTFRTDGSTIARPCANLITRTEDNVHNSKQLLKSQLINGQNEATF